MAFNSRARYTLGAGSKARNISIEPRAVSIENKTVHIIGGKLKGKKLALCKGHSIRPAMALVRKAIFDILQGVVIGANVLDLYAGTGSLGIEALSRGAKKLTLVDSDKTAINLIKKNLKLCNLEASVIWGKLPQVLSKLKKTSETFDLIFIDPPYKESQSIEKILEVISVSNLFNKDGFILVEFESKSTFQIPNAFSLYKEKRYGNTKVSFLRWKPKI